MSEAFLRIKRLFSNATNRIAMLMKIKKLSDFCGNLTLTPCAVYASHQHCPYTNHALQHKKYQDSLFIDTYLPLD